MTPESSPRKSKWALPGFMLWAFSPALLIALPVVGGWESGDIGAFLAETGQMFQMVGVFGMPFILYAWSVRFLRWYGHSATKAALFGLLLAIPMCAANLFLGIAGCNWMTDVVPKEGIF